MCFFFKKHIFFALRIERTSTPLSTGMLELLAKSLSARLKINVLRKPAPKGNTQLLDIIFVKKPESLKRTLFRVFVIIIWVKEMIIRETCNMNFANFAINTFFKIF